MVRFLAIAATLFGCTEHGQRPPDPGTDAAQPSACTVGDETKIKFTRAQSCGNDGSVEFCIGAPQMMKRQFRGNMRAASTNVNCPFSGAIRPMTPIVPPAVLPASPLSSGLLCAREASLLESRLAGRTGRQDWRPHIGGLALLVCKVDR